MNSNLYTATEFAELCERAAVQLRVTGKLGPSLPASRWLDAFHDKLKSELERRAAALAKDAAARPELRLIQGSGSETTGGSR